MKVLLQLLLSGFLLFLNCLDANGQNPGHLKFERLTTSEGLSQSTVYDMLQDSQGFMWFATQDGLNKYNGYDMTVYEHDPDNPGSLSYNRVSAIYEDSREVLWIGTLGRGLNRYDRDKDRFTHYSVHLPGEETAYYGNSVIDILEDSRENFWIGKSTGLYLMNRDTGDMTLFNMGPGLTDNSITVIYEDSSENLWVGTRNGLNLMDRDNKTFTSFQTDPEDLRSLGHPYVFSIFEDSQGTLWIGTRGGGMYRYQENTEDFDRFIHDVHDPFSISGNHVSSIIEDDRGNLWISTENDGLNVFDRNEERFFHYKSGSYNPESLSSNSILSLYLDDDNRLWAGTFDGGVSLASLDPTPFEHYKPEFDRPNSLSHHSVLSFGEDSAGNIWIGTDGGGLNRFDRDSKEFFSWRHNPGNSNSLSSDIVLEIFEDSFERLWIGTYGGGINVYDDATDTFRRYQYNANDTGSLSNNEAWSIFQDSEGTVWVGTCAGGLNRFDEDSNAFVRYMHDPNDPSSLINNFISTIFEDSAGRFWVGTYGGGISLMNRDTGTFTHYNMSNSEISDNVVLTMHEGQNGDLWVGTKGGGLNLFDIENDQFIIYNTSDGLPSNVVHGILEDDHGYLWLSTNNGLSKFNVENNSFTNFNLVHGLQSREFKEGSYFRDREGFMYFGGVNGFNRFSPDKIKTNTEVPRVVLTDFKIFNQPVSIGEGQPLQRHISRAEEITVPYSSSVLTFEFAALNFDFNKNNHYAYKLEGFDNDWNYIRENRTATYTNLNHGRYIFRVKASNNDGIWNDEAASIALIVTPPFWQTTWFMLLSLFLFVGLIVLGYRLRIRSITEQNKRLEQEVAQQTSELFNKNGELETTLKELNNTRGKLIERAHKAGMADLATNVLHNIGNILNSVNVSASMIDEILRRSKLQNLKQANELIRENAGDLERFIRNDQRVEKLLHYYVKLEEPLNREQEELTTHNLRLRENIKLMIDVVTAQQSYSTAGRVIEHLSLEELIEDTLVLQSASIERHNLDLVTDYKAVDDIYVEKSKVVHILVNLLKNAKESMSELAPDKKMISLKTFQDNEYVYLSITDKGCGIPEEDLKKIFNHGYTTKSYGHGFGLHSCANYMKELKGGIRVESEGTGKGATFTLCFPKGIEKAKELVKSNQASELADVELR